MTATLRTVAEHAGVSVRTVSNVVNGFQHVSPGMRAKVQLALDELGYQPNLIARSLRQGRTGVIGLIVPELDNPYFGALAHEVVAAATKHGLIVHVDKTGGDRQMEKQSLHVAIESQRLDGVLYSPMNSGDPFADLPRAAQTPIVLLGETPVGSDLDHVGIDDVAAIRQAVAHLAHRGRKRIAAIGVVEGTAPLRSGSRATSPASKTSGCRTTRCLPSRFTIWSTGAIPDTN